MNDLLHRCQVHSAVVSNHRLVVSISTVTVPVCTPYVYSTCRRTGYGMEQSYPANKELDGCY